MENPPKDFYRLFLGNEVRLKYAYIVKLVEIVKDNNGNVVELKCEYDPDTKSGSGISKKKVKTAIHWLCADDCAKAEIRLYDKLFTIEDVSEIGDKDFREFINPNSLIIKPNSLVEPSLKEANLENRYQFERLGYFVLDKYSSKERIIFNRSTTLKDQWKKKLNNK